MAGKFFFLMKRSRKNIITNTKQKLYFLQVKYERDNEDEK